jgi:hypothetical protein
MVLLFSQRKQVRALIFELIVELYPLADLFAPCTEGIVACAALSTQVPDDAA